MMRLTLVLACLLPVTLSPASGAGEALRPRITGLSHVALWVADLEKSRDFYKAYLGFDEPYTLRNADGSVALTWIKVNDRQSVELFPLGGRTPADGDSLYHVALETDDAQAMLRYLSARGVRGPEGKPLPATAKLTERFAWYEDGKFGSVGGAGYAPGIFTPDAGGATG